LKLTQHVKSWDDSEIEIGYEWESVLQTNLRTADIILILVSSDSISSKYVWERELPVAIERNDRGDAIVIPIFVRPCDIEGLSIAALQGLPRSGKAISVYGDPDEAYTEIARAIRRRISDLPRL
jgi:TIR domain